MNSKLDKKCKPIPFEQVQALLVAYRFSDGKNLRERTQLQFKLVPFCWLSIPQKQIPGHHHQNLRKAPERL